MVKHKFSKEKDALFFSTLRGRVNEYFTTTKKSRLGNGEMWLKMLVMYTLYLAPFIVLLTAGITNIWIFIGLWMLTGVGKALIGLNVMHDANHASFSKNLFINRMMGHTMDFVGSNAYLWKLQHNVLHHTFTNIYNTDEDIEAVPTFLRFSPHQRKRWIHRFQFIYAWAFYGLMSLGRVLISDFTRMERYKEMGLIKTKQEYNNEYIKMICWKIFYFSYILVLPIMFLPFSVGTIIICFLLMHFITGIILSTIFQTAHVMPTMAFPTPNAEGVIENSWAVHELETTTNFAPKSKLFSWFIGGLNYQVEHHLFSSICHVHYKALAPIVEQTAKEFGLPYYSEPTFASALWSHGKMLKKLGEE